MAQDFDPSGEDGTRPEVSPTGGLPADFFEEPVRPGSAPVVEALPPRGLATAPAARAVVDRRPILPIVGAVLLGNVVMFLGGMLAGWALAHKRGSSPRPDAAPAPDPRVPALARTLEAKAPRSEVEGLRSEVVALTRHMAQLEGRLESLPKPEPAPDLGPLRARVDDLARAATRHAALPESVRAVDARIGTLNSMFESLRTEVASLRKQLEEVTASRPEPAPPGSGPEDTDRSDRALRQGVTLFREGKYALAREAFLNQAEATPDDARPWYYAALANGFETRDWGGETERLVKRGMEREQAGTPERAAIDAEFADLTRAQGQDWLRAWRERVARR